MYSRGGTQSHTVHTPLTQAENLLGLYSALRALMTTVFRSIEHFMSAVAVTFTRRSTDAPQPGKGPMICASMAVCASDKSFRPAVEGTFEPEAELPAPAPPALSGGDAGGDDDGAADGLALAVRPLRRGMVSFPRPGRCLCRACSLGEEPSSVRVRSGNKSHSRPAALLQGTQHLTSVAYSRYGHPGSSMPVELSSAVPGA